MQRYMLMIWALPGGGHSKPRRPGHCSRPTKGKLQSSKALAWHQLLAIKELQGTCHLLLVPTADTDKGQHSSGSVLGAKHKPPHL